MQKKHLFKITLIAIFLLGTFLRAKGFLDNSSFWHDECALAWNIKFKNYSDFFGILNFEQAAPPFFMILTKFLTKIFGFSEWVFRLIPFLISCLSIFAFYFLAKKILNKNFSVLWAVFLFAINQTLINYSFEFKPYALDVFFSIVCILFFINWQNFQTKPKIIFSSLFIAIIPWFSFTSVFVIAAGFIINLFKTLKNKKPLFTLYPLLFTSLISVLIYLKIYALNNYAHNSIVDFWQPYFITNCKNFLWMLGNNLRFFFPPVKFVLLELILLVWGIVIFYKEAQSKPNTRDAGGIAIPPYTDNPNQALIAQQFFYISTINFLSVILLSTLHIYPFMERLVLFLLPIFLLFMVKPLDLISTSKKISSVFIILLFALTFSPQIALTKQLVTSEKFDKEEYAHEMMATMMQKIKPQDKIFVNSPSEPDFAYYSSFYGKKNIKIQDKIKNVIKNNYINELNSLPSGNYWFYLPIDYHNIPTIPWVEDWAYTKQIVYKNKFNGQYPSLLMYVKVVNGK